MFTDKLLKKSLHKLQESETSFLLIFSVLVGLVAGLGGIFFRWLIELFHSAFFDHGGNFFSALGPVFVLFVPIAGGLLSGPITYFFAKEAKGHGIPEVMFAARLRGGIIRARVAAVKILASSIIIGSGGSVGQEGPIAQIGASFGSFMGQKFRLTEEKIKILLAGGAAGGIAASFNAPMGGVFFALEVILGEYAPRYLSAVVISAVSATVVSRYYLGDIPAFVIPEYELISMWEIPLYLVMGFIIALMGVLFIKIVYKVEDFFEELSFPEYFKPGLGGVAVGFIGIFFPQVFGVGYEAIERALYGDLFMVTAFALIFLKMIATAFTVSSGGSGGIFAPALFIGSMIGVTFGHGAQNIFTDLTIAPGSYSVVGMGAFFAGVSGAPIATILILFEMTGDYKIILPLMITCVISTYVVRTVIKESIYSIDLVRKGIDIHSSKGMDLMASIKVSEAMITEIITVAQDATVRTAGLQSKSTRHRGFPVLNEASELVGIITHKDINKALSSDKAEDPVRNAMVTDLLVCYPEEDLRTALEKLGKKNIGRIPVVERDNEKKMIGFITRKCIIKAYNTELKKQHKNDLPGE